MIGKIVAVIPARGNSESIPLKNIKFIGGKPLIHWVIEAALNSSSIDEVYLMSDSVKIRDCVQCFCSRPRFYAIDRKSENATNVASMESVILEFAEDHTFETLILIQATSPLLTSSDINRGIEYYKSNVVDSVLSVVHQKRFIWKVNSITGNANPINYDYKNRPRRQEFDGYFVENGAFYITSRSCLLKSKCRLSGRIGVVEMAAETYIEIDELEDWIAVDSYLRKKETRNKKYLIV